MVAKVSVVGAAGYTGSELFRLLVTHRGVNIVGAYGSKSAGKCISEIHPNLLGISDMRIEEPNYDKIGKEADIVFMATPHGLAMKSTPGVLKGGAKVIDLSADYRFDKLEIFEKYYGKHVSPGLKSVYGLPELYREKIKRADLVANPGCYPTAAILSLAPLIKSKLIDLNHIIVDAKSGTSGAGATPSEITHHPLAGANFLAYSATTHRHGPEIDQELSKLAGKEIKASFTPHLLPIIRGILSTAHVFLKKKMKKEEILDIYKKFYRKEPFVRIREVLPQINFVVGSNYCDVGVEIDADNNRAVLVATIDNLIKGAAGQAIQNMNIMLGLDEAEGLRDPGMRP